MKRQVIIFQIIMLTIAVGFSGCKKDEVVPVSTTPEIAFVSMTPNPVAEFDQEVIITISYKDGDGDLGENNSEVDNIFVTDSRNQLDFAYRVKQLAPDNSEIVIQGELDIVLNNVTILDNSASEEKVSYDIIFIDRAGNVSNTITTDQLTITR